ncbi:unnamed protein product [Rotaria sordida]|uniref:Uncharacterized protein n=2 Tax=Rotaria sordida TaxID=392033 RepID=A0A815NWR5_9BILA|nr:unnamed protein product [Rotaria sordida]CAF3958627.1 unnamed protein product [Rotaria sordida]
MEKKIEKMIGNFTLTDVDLFQRNYFLKINDNVIVQVKRKSSRIPNQHIIEMKDINEQYQTFLLAFLILIDSILEVIQNPTNHRNPI